MDRIAHRTLPIALAMAISLPLAAAAAPIRKAAQPVDGQFIVVLRDGVVKAAGGGFADPRPSLPEAADEMAREHRGRSGRSYGHALIGFTFEGDREGAEALAADPRVAYVAEDGWVELAGQATPPSWGLDRVDQRPAALDAYYEYYADGAGVDVYVVDTGIRSTHSDFGGRIDLGGSFTALDDGYGTEDCNGHGTHVAGIVGGATFGVAKGVTLHAVRVLDCTGRGLISNIVAGLDWITARHSTTTTTDGGTSGGGGKKGGGKRTTSATTAASGPRAVVNMSLATTWTSTLDDAVANSIAAGIVYAIAAGNGSEDACYVSPARVPAAITVGSVANTDTPAASSNFGPCLDLYAPGVSIVSSFLRSDSDAVAMSGTSMAAPHVAGAAALLLSVNETLTPAEVATLIEAAATTGSLSSLAGGSPDRLLFAPFTGYGVDMAPVAEFTAACSGGNCKLSGAPSADDRGILGYDWELGNGKTATGEAVSVKYGRNAPDYVTVTLTVTDTTGQTTSVVKSVRTQY
jgi:subtilisin family serine protease